MNRRRLLALLALPFALLLAAWFGPRLLDWEAQRDRVAAIASARLGRPVVLGGPLGVTLLPQPMVEASAVLVGAEDDEGGIGVTARALRLRLGLWPLLAGRLEPRDLVLVGAEIRLPWPPGSLGALRPPPWLTGFDARIEDSRITVGGAVLEGVAARLAAPGPLDAVRAEGTFTSRGAPVRFEAVLGRPGFDGAATLDMVLSAAGARAAARGVLVAEGGFEGRIEASGPDIGALMAAPQGPFRATGRVVVTGELAAADDLVLDIAGITGRGAATFRFVPEPRLDIALALARLDLDAWVAALRGAAAPPLPVGLDLSAEQAAFHGRTLRRLRGRVLREGDRLALSGITALLPGGAEFEAAGGLAAGRLELATHVSGPSLRATLAGFGLPPEGTDPARLRAFSARARLLLEPAQLAVQDLAAMLDGARISGAGVLRFGARPALGLGLSFDRLDLDGLLPDGGVPAAALRADSGFDANLRLAAERILRGGAVAERAALDAAMEGGRVVIRRFSARVAEADVTLSGALALGATPRVADLALDVAASAAGRIAGVAAPHLPLPEGIAALPLRLRLSGGGPLGALALAAEGTLGELRIEGQSTLDLAQGRGQGAMTLRHPGAQRLALLLGAAEPPAWLGEGSFSLIASLTGSVGTIAAENLELVAGGLRARGQVALALEGARPRLTGRITAERLPLPGLSARRDAPVALGALTRLDAELALETADLAAPDLPPVQEARARLLLQDGRLALEDLRARLGGGALQGRLALDATAQPPEVSGALGLEGATLSGPLFGTPFDIASGEVAAQGRFTARGHAPAALLATLAGEGRFAVANGVLAGAALGTVAAAAGLEDAAAAEAGVRRGLEGGATAIERMAGGWRATDGTLRLEEVQFAAEGGTTGAVEGAIDLARGAIDLRFAVHAGPREAPAIALRATGPAETPRRQPEVAAWARWRAEQ
ncbi:AsmA-like C-terminal region-containing protein [Roseomonas sp. HF4]|uniref:AsmA family protein n=1 Tax=Roseomonas sp. HF4 TaxID=2562313 RepID=UPI0010C00ED6|nr:AsmA-like C-terminal region-containing protein [Roseomonas sp. HF4]